MRANRDRDGSGGSEGARLTEGGRVEEKGKGRTGHGVESKKGVDNLSLKLVCHSIPST